MSEISILMTAFNAEKYLIECLRSIQNQLFTDWQLVVVNDFSTDSTSEILKFEASKDSRILFFENKTKGILAALTLAFEYAEGNYITRMDADDIMPLDKLNLLYEIASANNRTVATGKVEYFADRPISEGYRRYQNWLNYVLENKLFSENVYRECVVASPNWMVHRSCFDKEIKWSDLKYPEDYDLVFQWYKNGYQIKGVNSATHLWREHAERTSRNSEIYQQESFFKLKTNYFIQLELRENEKIQLIGVGRKGKLVAEILNEKSIPFDWFEYQNDNLSAVIFPVEELSGNFKTILTNWPVQKSLQIEVENFLKSKNLFLGKNIWLF